MWIFPAIDLIGGRAVRLVQGDYAQQTVYHDDPLAQARSFRDAGARYLHTVDLDGAKSGKLENFPVIRRLIEESGLQVETGGGIRSMEVIRQYMEAGLWRVILGTAAVEDPALLEEAADTYGERIAVGADILEGRVKTRGWLEDGGLELEAFCQRLSGLGIRTLIVTDISRDGMMKGPNRELYRQLVRDWPDMQIVASGGVSSLEDVAALRDAGVYGAIIGKALYTGAIDLAEAVRAAGERSEA